MRGRGADGSALIAICSVSYGLEEPTHDHLRAGASGHKTLVRALIDELKKMGANEIVVTVGGIIPSKGYEMLEAAGVKAMFGPGTPIPKAARKVLGLIAG